jgi:hypothetical protein
MIAPAANEATVERFLELLIFDRFLFSASERMRSRGGEEFTGGLSAERRRIAKEMEALQPGAYASLARVAKHSKPKKPPDT